MKNKLMLIAAMTMAVTMTISASAQTNLAGSDVKVTVPFSFYAGEHSLPAGVYTVKSDLAHKILILRSDEMPGIFLMTNRREANNTPEQGRLMFKRYGSNYFLEEVWVTGRAEGQEVRSGKLERELASKAQPVEVVMVQPHSR
jgi:hypothetical protein